MTPRDLFGVRAANSPGFGAATALPDQLMLIQARKLHDAFEANEIAAEQEFKGIDLLVNGVVNKVLRRNRRIVVEMESGDAAAPVLCHFPEAEAPAVGTLERGQPVLVICRCTGRLARSVELWGCRLTEGSVEVVDVPRRVG